MLVFVQKKMSVALAVFLLGMAFLQGCQQREQDRPSLTCSFSIVCDTVFGKEVDIQEEILQILPQDGLIFDGSVDFTQGETVFDVLKRISKENGIPLEFVDTPAYGSTYIEGIANLYEFDAGELSGWMYTVNGEFPGYGCSQYVLADGDQITWAYTVDLGADVRELNTVMP